MTPVLAAVGGDAPLAFIEIGLLALGLALVARFASRLGITAVPFYLLAGLGLGEGGIVTIDVSEDFVAIGAEIGVLLLLFTLGLEYSTAELGQGLRTGIVPGVTDAVLNVAPGFALGLVLGWSTTAAILLGGVTWVSFVGCGFEGADRPRPPR
jgi:monovalent cation:H+ antiporter-2, CPA2 family